VFKAIGRYGAEPVIYPTNIKHLLINLYITKRFQVKGDPKLVELHKDGMVKKYPFGCAFTNGAILPYVIGNWNFYRKT
jgi:hypothetical protein